MKNQATNDTTIPSRAELNHTLSEEGGREGGKEGEGEGEGDGEGERERGDRHRGDEG